MLQRHRSKVIGFIIAEASAIGLLLLAGSFARRRNRQRDFSRGAQASNY
jgi:hypothetical protein